MTNKNFNKSEFREMHVTTAFKESKDLSDFISYVEVCQYDQDKNLILPDTGSILDIIKLTTKKNPKEIFGKPNPIIFENILDILIQCFLSLHFLS